VDNKDEWAAWWWANAKIKGKKSICCQEKAKAKPSINRIRNQKLSLGDVQTCDGIFEIMHKPKNPTTRTLLY
jgi:hypothetical protein